MCKHVLLVLCRVLSAVDGILLKAVNGTEPANQVEHLFTDRVRSTRGGYVFTLSTIWEGGYLPWPGCGGTYLGQGGGVPTLAGVGGTYLGQGGGGTYLGWGGGC